MKVSVQCSANMHQIPVTCKHVLNANRTRTLLGRGNRPVGNTEKISVADREEPPPSVRGKGRKTRCRLSPVRMAVRSQKHRVLARIRQAEAGGRRVTQESLARSAESFKAFRLRPGDSESLFPWALRPWARFFIPTVEVIIMPAL